MGGKKISEKRENTMAQLLVLGVKHADIKKIVDCDIQTVYNHMTNPTYQSTKDIMKKGGVNYESGLSLPSRRNDFKKENEKKSETKKETKDEVIQEKFVKGSLDYLEDIGNGFLNFMEAFEKEMGVVLEKQEKDHDVIYQVLHRLETLERK